MPKTGVTYQSLAWITVPEVDTELLWTLSLIFVALAGLYFVSVFFFRSRIATHSERTKRKKTQLAPMISEFLFYEEGGDKDEKSNYINLKIEIRELLKNEFDRKVLTEILLDLRKDVSGDTQRKLFKLYQDLGLDKDAFQKLESWRWERISKGILELTQMNVEGAYTFIIKFINDKRSTIRKQAEIAAVTLKPEGISYFLDSTRYKISEWQQLKLLDVIRNQENFEPPRFKNWLTSTNRHVVLFALRAIKYYNQNDAKSALIELVKHKNNQIKQEAIGCIKEFYIVESLPVLKQVFWKGNLDVKLVILDTIGALGSEPEIAFLRKIAYSTGNFSVKSKALSAINMISPDTVMPTQGIENVEVGEEPATPEGKPVFENPGDSINFDSGDTRIQEEGDIAQSEHPAGGTAQGLKSIEVITDTSSSVLSEEAAFENTNSAPTTTEAEKEGHSSNSENAELTIGAEETEMNLADLLPAEQSMMSVDLREEEDELSGPPLEKPEYHEEANRSDDVKEEKNSDTENDRPISNAEQDEEGIKEPDDRHAPKLSLSLDFLPIVTDNEAAPFIKTIKKSSMENTNEPEKKVEHIEVHFEEVLSDRRNIGSDTKISEFDIDEIAFLPIVTDNEDSTQEGPKIRISGGFGEASLGVGAELEDRPDPFISDDKKLLEEIDELGFLPIVTDNTNEEIDATDKTSDNTEGIEGFTLADFEITFDEAEKVPNIVNTDKEIAGETPDSQNEDSLSTEQDDVISWLMATNELREIEVEYEKVNGDGQGEELLKLIPEPIYYDEHEAYMMGLLDDLEDLGDHREVPFLQELLAERHKDFVKDRIKVLIDRFTRPSVSSKEDKADSSKLLPFFSVFADLFKNLDVEAKLILLDEVVAVGDHKEIDFLDSLLEDPNPKIRKKASLVLKQLIEKLSTEETEKLEISAEPLGAERQWIDFSDEFGAETGSAEQNSYKKLLKNMAIASSGDDEIFDLDFELLPEEMAEMDPRIREMPVEMVVVSPNPRNFLSQIRTFPKKMRGNSNG